MNCDGSRGLLSAYLDGELSPGELLRVEQHLRRCHACADEVDSLRQTIALVQSLDEVEVPVSFRASLHERLVALGPPVPVRKIPVAPVWQRHLRTWALPAAAAAAVLAVGMGQLSQLGSTPDGLMVRGTALVEQTQVAVENPPAETKANPVAVIKPPVTPPATDPLKVDPPKPVDSSGESVTTPPPPADKGKLAPNLGIYTASLLTGVTEPKALPAREYASYSLTATVAEPVETAGKLQGLYQAEVLPAVGKPGIVTSVVFTVPAKDVEKVLAGLRAVLGEKVSQEAPTLTNLAESIQLSYASLEGIELIRERVINSAYGKEDLAQVESLKVQLEKIAADAARAKQEYDRLLQRVNTATITVYLQK